jgi:4-hydroxy-tetrahydrodipicolinate reductase
MKIALIGYGKMGKEIEKIAHERNHLISLIIDINNPKELTAENLKKAEVAIDFSVPETAYSNIMACFEAGIPVVSGTTGWLDKFDEVTDFCKNNGKTFFYASNYSIGVNIFFAINKRLAELMNKFTEYNVEIEETHHIHKLDAPSGTAITIANDIINKLDRKTVWELDKSSNIQSIKIKAIREGEVPGIHIVNYDSPVDSIEIKHSAKSRKGFALGAVLAAEFICKKTGFFTMNNLMHAE